MSNIVYTHNYDHLYLCTCAYDCRSLLLEKVPLIMEALRENFFASLQEKLLRHISRVPVTIADSFVTI